MRLQLKTAILIYPVKEKPPHSEETQGNVKASVFLGGSKLMGKSLTHPERERVRESRKKIFSQLVTGIHALKLSVIFARTLGH